MAVRAITKYEFPSRSRQELFGDNRLVNIWWKGNTWFGCAACALVPKAMTWADFLAGVVYPIFSADPDFNEETTTFAWTVDDHPVSPAADQTLVEIGVGHKSLIAAAVT